MTESRSHPRRLVWSLVGLLDWVLPPMLVGALLLAVAGAHYLHAGRWSLGALVWGSFGAAQGATLGITAWASWTATRRLNVLAGLLGGLALGLVTHAVLTVVYTLVAAEIVRYPEPIVPATRRALEGWFGTMQVIAYHLILIAGVFSCAAFFKQSATKQDAGSSGELKDSMDAGKDRSDAERKLAELADS